MWFSRGVGRLDARAACDHACGYRAPLTTLHVVTGLPGAGKAHDAAPLLDREPGVHVAMDDAQAYSEDLIVTA